MIQKIELPQGLQTASFVMGDGALETLPEFLQQVFPGRKPWIVADGNTYAAAGKRAHELLAGNCYEPYIFPAEPRLHPDTALSDMLAAKIAEMPGCVPVAVGSGVINDLVKVASGQANVTYCCVPTAASVDGYTSSGGAMSHKGFKTTIACPAPYGLLVDTAVLDTAPPEMFAAGYADLFAKIPAGGDWLIADQMGSEAVDPQIWELVQMPLKGRLADPAAFEPVFAGLASTGYAMQIYKDSRPASGAEHLCSHVWEMEGFTNNGEEVSHGFKVAVGTIASTLMQEFIIEHSFEELASRVRPLLSEAERRAEIAELLKLDCYGSGVAELGMSKFQGSAERREKTREVWESLRKILPGQLIAFDKAVALLRQAKSPVHYRDIGLSEAQFLHGIRTAQLIRKRYTVLDYLYDAGLLECALEYVKKRLAAL